MDFLVTHPIFKQYHQYHTTIIYIYTLSILHHYHVIPYVANITTLLPYPPHLQDGKVGLPRRHGEGVGHNLAVYAYGLRGSASCFVHRFL